MPQKKDKHSEKKLYKISRICSRMQRKSTSRGAIILEAVLAIPIFLCMIFFIIELMKINETAAAMAAISTEATFDFIANGNKGNFDKIIEKYRPPYIPMDNIRYWFRFYESPDKMCEETPYGGEDIVWPEYGSDNAHLDIGAEPLEYIPSSDALIKHSAAKAVDNIPQMKSYIDGKVIIPFGTIFVLTFVCDYPFSNFSGRLFFFGKSNTRISGSEEKGTKYLLWGRGVGVVGSIIIGGQNHRKSDQ
ncbi:MAG: hypothetical protein LBC04_00675 [Holosporaceae bacterium]|jgi:hypothetical protein|nr:hypothetical protein [Holosporaceae bacterium]